MFDKIHKSKYTGIVLPGLFSQYSQIIGFDWYFSIFGMEYNNNNKMIINIIKIKIILY